MKIAIIGAGFTGLTLGYELSKKKHSVIIFEKNSFVGGLASGFKYGEWFLERFYHHIFKSDKDIQNLVKDLGLEDIWIWKDCGAPIFYNQKIYPFSTPLDLLKFSPMSVISRLRTGLCSLFLQLNKDYGHFENSYAEEWLKKYMGIESWKAVWYPLMHKKFGNEYKKISMSWIWARINKRSRYLGYPKEGFQIIIDKLVEKIKLQNGQIILNREINISRELNEFDKVIYTGPSKLLATIYPDLPENYKQKLNYIKNIGTVVLLLMLKKPITDWVYWLNINDINIPFVGCVQHSNFMDKDHYKNLNPVYFVAYTPKDSDLYKEQPQKIMNKWIKYLVKINKNFKNQWIKEWFIFKEAYTQPIFKLGDQKNILEFQTPINNLYIVNMSQIYPWDRGLNYSVDIANRFINKIFN